MTEEQEIEFLWNNLHVRSQKAQLPPMEHKDGVRNSHIFSINQPVPLKPQLSQ